MAVPLPLVVSLHTWVVVTWQLDWSVQAAQLTPYLLVVGVPYQYYTLACLCGPISGLIVQPLMGVFSDHCHSRLGRRRPFIIAGVLLIVFGLMLIANSAYIGRTLWGSKYGVATDSQGSHSTVLGRTRRSLPASCKTLPASQCRPPATSPHLLLIADVALLHL